MPAVPAAYNEGKSEDARWPWYLRVPAAWRDKEPAEILRYAAHVMDVYGVTYQGAAPDLATYELDDLLVILVKSDVDPLTLIDTANLPPPPLTEAERRANRLTVFRNGVRSGQSATSAQQDAAIADLIELALGL